ncbi:MAG TPA: hypothetical protein VGE07_12580 [Herpetosiphonaceae bacterium]
MAHTPFPGSPLPPDDAAATIERFRGAFRIHTAGRHPRIPTWCAFPDAGARYEWDDLPALFAALPPALVFYNEHGPHPNVWLASPAAILAFFTAKEPWEQRDFYVFDASCRWCLCVTHDDAVLTCGEPLPGADPRQGESSPAPPA